MIVICKTCRQNSKLECKGKITLWRFLIILKRILKKQEVRIDLYSADSLSGPLSSPFEHGNEISDSMKTGIIMETYIF
jgi:hypothetical protein